MPNNMINIYDTRFMLEQIEQFPKRKTYLKDNFFNNIRTFPTIAVDYDLVKGKRQRANLQSQKAEAQAVHRLGYETKTFEPPKTAPYFPTTALDAMKRLPGENIYSLRSPNERLAELLTKDLVKLDDMITRLEEWMCAQIMFTGKLPVKGKGIDTVIDFEVTHLEEVAANKKWSQAGSKPLDDLKRWRIKVLQDSGYLPTEVIMSSELGDIFINSEQVQKIVCTYRDYRVEIIPTEQRTVETDGTILICRIASLGLDIKTYDEWIVDNDTGRESPLIPADTICMAVKGIGYDFCYAACEEIVDEQMVFYETTRLPHSWTEKNPHIRFIGIDSKPLPILNRPDTIFIAKVV